MPAEDAVENGPSTSTSPYEHRSLPTSGRSQSSNKRFSIASTDTGESSRSASTRPSTLLDHVATGQTETSIEDQRNAHHTTSGTGREHKRSHRLRQSRSSGGFLLSSTIGLPGSSEHPSSRHSAGTNRPDDASRTHKGKSVKEEGKQKAGAGLSIASSPLASNVASAVRGERRDAHGSDFQSRETTRKDFSADSQSFSTGLDLDSAQMVNLALNLSESRKLAARRNVTTPIVPSTGFEEGVAGGSLKFHLQQQRRSSRNISPKPDKLDRTNNTSPQLLSSGSRMNGAFRGTASTFPDGEYHYVFSPSTLARSEKARNSIELMAQYRRLLQYVPPLKPTSAAISALTPPSTSSNSPGSANIVSSRPVSSGSSRPLGRQYNPLQYIRNRKLRARERSTLDGESQGFGDVHKVKAWVDQISSESVQQGYGTNDVVPLPDLPGSVQKPGDSTHESPLAKNVNQSKYKRPRMDWIFTPEDLLADVHWLEQGDNKKRIEDREGRKIFPQRNPLKRPMSYESRKSSIDVSGAAAKLEDSDSEDQAETELPKFRSMKSGTTRGRARQKIHDTIHGHHRHSGSFSDTHWKNRSDSDASRSEDESSRFRRSGRSRSPPEPGRSLLEKQMAELLIKESRENDQASSSRDYENHADSQSIEPQTPLKERTSLSYSAGSSVRDLKFLRQVSRRRTDSNVPTLGRSSLEVPYARSSLEGYFDSTAPSSPLAKAVHPEEHVSRVNVNVSRSPSRTESPARKSLQRVRSKIHKLQDRSRHPTNELSSTEHLFLEEEKAPEKDDTPTTPISPVGRKRSLSPIKKLLSSKTDSSIKSTGREGSIRRKKGDDDSSGFRGLIKGGRHIVRGPVSQVKDLLWKKDVDSSGSSDDDSLDESAPVIKPKNRGDVPAKESDRQNLTTEIINHPSKSYLKDMPSFHSSRDRHRLDQLKINDTLPAPYEGDHVTRQRRTLSGSRSPRFDLLKPPRIDVQSASPTSSPDFAAIRQISHDSDVSDIEPRRNAYADRKAVYGADTKLNAILGLPGHIGIGPPMTGLATASLEKRTHDHSHSDVESDGHRPEIGGRQWSISDRTPSQPRGPITKREIARVRALLLSTGVKAKEIARREEELIDLRDASKSAFAHIATTMLPDQETDQSYRVPKYQEHALAARLLTRDIQLSAQVWQASANTFSAATIPELTARMQALKERVTGLERGLTALCRRSADEADALGKELVGERTMAVKGLTDTMEMMQRRRRRRFRWVRRGGWVVLEWVLVGVMWWVWLCVVLIRTVRGLGGAVVGALRWLFWL